MTYPVSSYNYNNAINLLNSSFGKKASTGPDSVFSFVVASAYNSMLNLSGRNDNYIDAALGLLTPDIGFSEQNYADNILSSLTPAMSLNVTSDDIFSLYNYFSNNTNNPWQSLGTLIDAQL